MKTLIKSTAAFTLGAFVALGAIAQDQPAPAEPQASSLDQLLEFVKEGQTSEARENRAREQRFQAAKADQQRLLNEAKAERTRQEQISAQLEKTFEDNELLITDKQKALRDRLGTLTELFGHLTSAAGDASTNFGTSLVSVQYPNREQFLEELIAKMAAQDQLPSIEEIERVWYELQREATESGRVARFTQTVSRPNGDKVDLQVVRVGSWNVVSEEGKYLTYVPEKGSLEELSRQPAGPFQGWAASLVSADSGLNTFGVDPTGPAGGGFLSALINSPTIEERWHQGGYIGYAITAVGAVAFLIAIWRLIVLAAMSAKVSSQLKSSSANTNNPLGRVLKVHEDNPNMDTETLELKLEEAILKETPSIENSLTLLKIISTRTTSRTTSLSTQPANTSATSMQRLVRR